MLERRELLCRLHRTSHRELVGFLSRSNKQFSLCVFIHAQRFLYMSVDINKTPQVLCAAPLYNFSHWGLQAPMLCTIRALICIHLPSNLEYNHNLSNQPEHPSQELALANRAAAERKECWVQKILQPSYELVWQRPVISDPAKNQQKKQARIKQIHGHIPHSQKNLSYRTQNHRIVFVERGL